MKYVLDALKRPIKIDDKIITFSEIASTFYRGKVTNVNKNSNSITFLREGNKVPITKHSSHIIVINDQLDKNKLKYPEYQL